MLTLLDKRPFLRLIGGTEPRAGFCHSRLRLRYILCINKTLYFDFDNGHGWNYIELNCLIRVNTPLSFGYSVKSL